MNTTPTNDKHKQQKYVNNLNINETDIDDDE